MTCRRFETEGFELVQRGEALTSHFENCSDCLAAREEYDRIVGGFAAMRNGPEPPPGWQAAVWQGVEERSPSRVARIRWPRLLFVVPALAAVALVAILVPTLRNGSVAALTTTVLAGETPRRGPEATVGDRLRIEASSVPAGYSEIRLYFNESELLLRCSGDAPCPSTGVVLLAEVTLDRRGSYRTVLITSDSPIPPPEGSLDRDSGKAIAAGGEVVLGEAVRVR